MLSALAAAALVSRFPPPGTLGALCPVGNPSVVEARFQRRACNGVQCGLCPFHCFLPEGVRGRCKVRMASGGRLKSLVYGRPVSVHIDPIEKKPVFHLLPGSWIYSLATAGCNLACRGCQNWEISQIHPEQAPAKLTVPASLSLFQGPDGRVYGSVKTEEVSHLPPERVVEAALKTRSKSIAYTYSEPVVFYEYMYDTAKLAKSKGLRNVMVSGGYIDPAPLAELAPYMDVVKVDLKGFDPAFYKDFSGGELGPVKRTLKTLKSLGVLTEVVNLVVPTLNDRPEDLRALAGWVRDELGRDTPLFFSRFSPNYRLQNLPQTPDSTLTSARDAALEAGLRFVYVGNLPGSPGENTLCPKCGRVLVRRAGYAVLENLLTPNKGRCPYDGTRIPGVWDDSMSSHQTVTPALAAKSPCARCRGGRCPACWKKPGGTR